MKVTPTRLPEVLRIQPRVHADERGRFFELWQEARFAEAGIPARFVQDNVSVSRRGVVRGLHLQHPNGQGKLVTVVRGAVLDVAVDLRVGSPRFGQWVGVTLDDGASEQLWIPPGFAHGFAALSDEAVLAYKVTASYDAAADFTVRWDDPAIGIDWPVRDPILSAKDAVAPRLAEIPEGRLPRYADAG